MSQIQIQRHKKLSDYIRSAIGKYEQITGSYAERDPTHKSPYKHNNKRCIVGAIASEMGWDAAGRFPTISEYLDEISMLLPNGILVEWNDSGMSFEQILKEVEFEERKNNGYHL